MVLLYALEDYWDTERAAKYRPALGKMLDRILESANADGMLYDEIRCSDLKPERESLADNWGYVYSAVYTFYMVTGEVKYRDAVRRALKNTPKYLNYDWERGSQDGVADALEARSHRHVRIKHIAHGGAKIQIRITHDSRTQFANRIIPAG